MKSRHTRFHCSAPPVYRSHWSERWTDSESGSRPSRPRSSIRLSRATKPNSCTTCDFNGQLHWVPVATDRFLRLSLIVDQGLKQQSARSCSSSFGTGDVNARVVEIVCGGTADGKGGHSVSEMTCYVRRLSSVLASLILFHTGFSGLPHTRAASTN